MINVRDFRAILQDFILPLFPGATIERASRSADMQRQLVSRIDPCRIAVKPSDDSRFCLVITRSQAFAADNSANVTESKVISAFAKLFAALPAGLSATNRDDLLEASLRHVVVKAICTRESQERAVLMALDQLAAWSERSYEGRAISAAIGFESKPSSSAISLEKLKHEDYLAVLSNGTDTMLVCDYQAVLLGYQCLSQPRKAPRFAPHRHAPIAHWARNGRIALALNRSGDILVFRDQELLFVRRQGTWSFLAHGPALTQMKLPRNTALRTAIYESALDASFARSGAAIGVVMSAHLASHWRRIATKKKDYLATVNSDKARALRTVVGQTRFHNLDRRCRQEILAIDGATLISHSGIVLAVGAILRIKGGSTGGGRLAAALELSRLGLGIKVSQDGPIRGYRGSFRTRAKTPSFLLM